MAVTVEAIRRGRHWEIVAVVRANRNEVANFLDALSIPAQKKIDQMFRIIADDQDGPFLFRNEQKMRHLGDDVYELKSDQVRLLFFIDRPRRLVVATGFLKKTAKTPGSEIARAKLMRTLYYGEAP
jgi:phage-related protein